jgi:dienelactone hydrolase
MDRVYVTGISMGGFATWETLIRYPEKFAAAIPVCGGGDVSHADRIKNIPIWAFHGANDSTVPVQCSRSMVEMIERAGGHPRYTEYPGVGHNSWDCAYAEPELLSWLFSQKRLSGVGWQEAVGDDSQFYDLSLVQSARQVGLHPAPVSRGLGRMDSMSFSRNGAGSDPTDRWGILRDDQAVSLDFAG